MISQRLTGDDHLFSRVEPGYNPISSAAVGCRLNRSNKASTLHETIGGGRFDLHVKILTDLCVMRRRKMGSVRADLKAIGINPIGHAHIVFFQADTTTRKALSVMQCG